MKLAEWLDRHGWSNDDFAQAIGRHRTDVYRYRRGQHMPRAEIIAAIERVTHGAVTATDLYEAIAERSRLERSAA
jgi:ribosome-binding protein aMBF1 (putative translation factor)